MSRFSQHQHPWWPLCAWRCGVWLSLLLLLAVSPTAYASPSTPDQAHPSVADGEAADAPRARPPREGEDPRVIFAQAQAWPAHGAPFPDAVLRQAVETALRPEAPWDQVTAAITAFDLYHDRPWVTQVLQPFVVYHAATILVNADVFVRIHRAWTTRAVAMAAPQAPGLVLSGLKTLSAIDPVWAKQLATTAAATMPAAVWPHVDILLTVDVSGPRASCGGCPRSHPMTRSARSAPIARHRGARSSLPRSCSGSHAGWSVS